MQAHSSSIYSARWMQVNEVGGDHVLLTVDVCHVVSAFGGDWAGDRTYVQVPMSLTITAKPLQIDATRSHHYYYSARYKYMVHSVYNQSISCSDRRGAGGQAQGTSTSAERPLSYQALRHPLSKVVRFFGRRHGSRGGVRRH
jgi:hypothetical protein